MVPAYTGLLGSFLDRHCLARDRCLLNKRLSTQHNAIDRYASAGLYHDRVTGLKVAGRYVDHFVISPNGYGPGQEVDQVLDIQNLSGEHKRRDHQSSEEFADGKCR